MEQLGDYLKEEKEDIHIVSVCNYVDKHSQEGSAVCANKGFTDNQSLEGGTSGWFQED